MHMHEAVSHRGLRCPVNFLPPQPGARRTNVQHICSALSYLVVRRRPSVILGHSMAVISNPAVPRNRQTAADRRAGQLGYFVLNQVFRHPVCHRWKMTRNAGYGRGQSGHVRLHGFRGKPPLC